MHDPQQEVSEAEVEAVWMQAVANEWREELADPRQDIYTLEDGEPITQKAREL